MRFKKIKIKNIRSYRSQEIEFPEGSLLLSGDVGAGKTTILLAIEYALFGLQPGQKGTSLLRNDSDVGEVKLEMEISGRTFTIERKLRRSSKGVSNEYAAIIIDGEKVESSITELKSKIVSLLGYPQEFIKKNNALYRYTVYTPQEHMKQIILEDSETRLNILRHVFGIEKFKRIRDNLDLLMSNLKTDAKILQGEILSLDDDKSNLQERKEKVNKVSSLILEKENEFQDKIQIRIQKEKEVDELEERLKEKRIFEREIDKTKILLTTKKEYIYSISSELENLNKSILGETNIFREENLQNIKSEIITKKSKTEAFHNKYWDLSNKIVSLSSERETILQKKERIFRIDICPTCLQDVSENHKHNILNETEKRISEIKNEIEFYNQEKEQVQEIMKKFSQDVEKLEEEKMKLEILKSKIEYLEKSKNRLVQLEAQKQSLDKDISLLINHMESLKAGLLKFAPIEYQLSIQNNELKQEVLSEKYIEIALAELKKELEISSKEIIFLNKAIQKKEMSKEKLYKFQELLDWLSTQFLNLIEFTERNVLLKLRHEFSGLFRKWFLLLVPDNSLDSQIDENFTPIIMQGESEMDYSFLSGGERTAVALAYRLALNQTINSVLSKIKTRGIIILDEPTDGFSDAQITKMRDIFEELNTDQLIIVSHEQKIESFVDNVLRIFKEGNISMVEFPTSPILSVGEEIPENQKP